MSFIARDVSLQSRMRVEPPSALQIDIPRFRFKPATVDRFGFRHSSPHNEAVAAFETAVHGVAAHKPSTGADLSRAIVADPNLVAAHVLKGFANLILAREELLAPARGAYRDARAALLAAGGGTGDEAALVQALGEALEGRFSRAAMRLDELVEENPRAFLPAKIAHALRFMLGDVSQMLAASTRLLKRWPLGAPGFGFLLGCHAFALEESGDLGAAERVGRCAIEIEPEDAWGLHAVSHVHEMQGRTREGIAWIERSRPIWTGCNNFCFHMAWHLALFHLETGAHDRVVAIYDEQVRPQPTDDFRDVANAVSLLWRLEQQGVSVGSRWDELRTIALKRGSDTTLTFACLHNLLTLIAVGEIDAAWDLVRALEAKADSGEGDQSQVMDVVGIDLARALLELALNRAPQADFAALAKTLQRIGGSYAQRDVFMRTLAEFAVDRSDRDAFQKILSVRRRLKRDDRFVASLERRLAGAASWRRRFSTSHAGVFA